MAYSVRYQVFLSSTYTDLKEERSEVLQALWELDCIPTGMEAFVATSESQWEVIQKVIDECDYYVLIIGGRYGSLTNEGMSYTEKEYEYARSIGLPVLAFVHEDVAKIPSGKVELDEVGRKRLDAFRAKVMVEYPVRRWATAQELGGVVSRSLSREMKVNPQQGWIRHDGSSPIELLEQVNKLNVENKSLKEKIENLFSVDAGDLAGGQDKYTIRGHRQVKIAGVYKGGKWTAVATWDDLFRDIGPALINEATSEEIDGIIRRFHGWAKLGEGESAPRDVTIYLEAFNEIIVQFRALGLIGRGQKRRGVNDKNSYWAITEKGERYLMSILAKRKKVETQ